MSSSIERAVIMVVGVVLGAGATTFLGRHAAEPASTGGRVMAAHVAPQAEPSVSAAPTAPHADPSMPELAQCEQLRDFYKAQLVVYEGTPQPWPTGGAPDFTEPNRARTLAASIAPVGRVESLDCNEYPCVAASY